MANANGPNYSNLSNYLVAECKIQEEHYSNWNYPTFLSTQNSDHRIIFEFDHFQENSREYQTTMDIQTWKMGKSTVVGRSRSVVIMSHYFSVRII